MKYEGAYEAIQVAIPVIESAEETGVRLATYGIGNSVAYFYLIEARLAQWQNIQGNMS